MADIQQAAKWMLEGKQVRSASIAGKPTGMAPNPLICPNYSTRIFMDDEGRIVDENGMLILLSVRGLLKDDWEIVE